MSRIRDVPYYAQRDDEVSAKLYNLWRRAKLHFPCPIRFPLPDCPGMVMILEEREWVCADERQNDLPVLAWVEFADQGRDALHQPVRCKLNYYHFAASRMRARALASMGSILEGFLRNI
ncbi:hypothetical protein [Thiolapillus sp.]